MENTKCTHCQQETKIPPAYLGNHIKCPACANHFIAHAQTPPTHINHNERFCINCHTIAQPKTHTPGNIIIEIALWLLLLIPGILYSIWRLTARKKVCPACLTPNQIPTTSPAAQTHLTK